MMKRVLIVATTSYAGMGPYVSEIINGFSLMSDVYFFFCDSEDDFYKKNVKEELHVNSFFFRLNNTKWNKIRDLLPIKKSYHSSVLSLCKKKSIEIVHFINGPGDIYLVKELNEIGIKSISTVHDLHPHESKKEWYKEFRSQIIYDSLQKNFIYGENYITNGVNQYEEIVHAYPEKNVFYHTFPTLVTKTIREGKDVPPELQGLSTPYILFFGRIEEYKGVSLLYDVFTECTALHDQYSLVIAGAGTLPFKRKKEEKNVILINRYVADTEIAFIYEHAHCVVYPYISATQSGVLSLAFYYGIPVLASDVPFFKSMIVPNQTGLLFKTGDKIDLEIKLNDIVRSNRQSMGDLERNCYQRLYDAQIISRELLDIYGSIK